MSRDAGIEAGDPPVSPAEVVELTRGQRLRRRLHSRLPRNLPRPRYPKVLPKPPHPKLMIADLLTACNIASGVIAITYMLDDRLVIAAAFMALAVVFDGLDGPAARHFGSFHKRGATLDSLADAVSFGIAPSLLIYANFFTGNWVEDPLRNLSTLMVVGAIFIGSILRLYRFTILKAETKHFNGLPTPAMAGTVVYLSLLFGANNSTLTFPWLTEAWQVALPMAAILAVLMITTLPYPKFRGKQLLLLAFPLSVAFVPVISRQFLSSDPDLYVSFNRYMALIGFVWYLAVYILTGPLQITRRQVKT